MLGRIVPEIGGRSIRERFVYSYRIIYRLEAERILVAAVIHGSRLLQHYITRIEGAQKSNP
jgi:toxin ParE1/3/4